MVKLVNRAKMTTATTGTGTITLGSASTGYQSFADAGVSDADVVRYVIEDGADWEIGSGTYTASGTTLARTTILESSNADAALILTGDAVVFVSAIAEDIVQPDSTDTLTNKSIDGSTNTITNVDLSTDVTGNLPVTNLNSGTAATATSFWRGDGTWALPSETNQDPDRSTGLYYGGVLSIGSPTSTFSISAGEGQVVDHSTTPGTVGYTSVSWTVKSNLTVTNLATNLISWVGINAAGTVVQQVTSFTNVQRRSIIVLGVIVHVDNTVVNAVNNEQHPIADVAGQMHDLAHAIGFINVDGNVFAQGTTGGLYIQQSAGNVFAIGSNWETTVDNPHTLALPARDNLGFQYRTQTGTNRLGSAAGELVIDPDTYDNAGTFTTVPSNKWTVQRIYVFLSGDVKLQPGQGLYGSIDAARESIAGAAFVTEPSILANGILRGFLIIQEGTTDLADAEFIAADKFGVTSGAGVVTGKTFLDTDFRIQDDGDTSKQLAFQVSGITTGTTRTWTVPDADVTVTTFAGTVLDDANAAAAATTLGLGTGDSPQFTAVNIGHATDTTLARVSAGVASIEGDTIALLTATQTLTNKTHTDIILDGSVTEQVYAWTETTGAVTGELEPAEGTVQTVTLTGNVTSLTDNVAAGESITLGIDDGTAYTITWPTITWVNNAGAAPTLATSGYTWVAIWKVSTTLYGALVGDGT